MRTHISCCPLWRWIGIVFPVLCFFFAVNVVHAGENIRPGIVVWKLSANQEVNEEDVNLLSNFVANQVAKYSGYKVISEADIWTILKGEETRQRCGVNDTSCVAEIGNALGVPEAVSGDIGKIGSYWMLNLRRINVHSADVVGRSSRNVEGSVDNLIRVLPGAVAQLFGIKDGKMPPAIKVPTTGILSVHGVPEGSDVLLDGKLVGQTPFEKSFKVGKHKISLEHRGYVSHEDTLRILPGGKTNIKVDLERIPPGRLHIASEPSGAVLLLDGKEGGETPYNKKVEVGDYKLELKLEGYKTLEDYVTVNSKETMRLKLTLEHDYPMNPYKKYGYVTFFTGVGFMAFGALSTGMSSMESDNYDKASSVNSANDAEGASRSWMGAAYAGYTIGGALMITGIVLWVLSPGDQQWWEDHQVSTGPTPDGSGGTLSLNGRW